MTAAPSPERAALTAACAKRDGVNVLIAKLRAAEEEHDEALMALYGEQEAAEEALAEAKRTERRRTISVILGEPLPAGPDTNTALERLAEIKRTIATKLGDKTAIEEHLRQCESQIHNLGIEVRAAEAAIIASELAAVERLLELKGLARAVERDVDAALLRIGKTRLPNEARFQHWEATNFPPGPPTTSIDASWQEALAALDGGDAAQPLPMPGLPQIDGEAS